MRPLRVLQLTNMYPDAERPYFGIFVKHLVDGLAAEQVESTVLTIDARGKWKSYADGAVAMRRALRREPFDLVHAHYGLTGTIGALQRRRPLVISMYGGDVHVDWQRRASLPGALLASAVLFCSKRMQDELPRRVRGEIVSPGIDMGFFKHLDRQAARAALGWPEAQPVVLFPSDPTRWDKDYPLFEAAIARLATPGVRTVTFGKVPASQLALMYNAADCMLMTSVMEGSPTVVKEGLACGLPLVSVDVGDVREQIVGIPGCEVIDDRDPARLAAAVDRVLRRHERVADTPSLRRMDHASVARRVREIYDRVLREHISSSNAAN